MDDNNDSGTSSGYSGEDSGSGDDGTNAGDGDASESTPEADTSLGVEDASIVHPPSEWGQRIGQFWSGVGDWAEGTASSVVHLGEYAYDSATGDDAAAKQREADMGNDWNQITHGVQEIADLM